MCTTCVWEPMKIKRGLEFPRTKLQMVDREPPRGCWKQDWGTPREQELLSNHLNCIIVKHPVKQTACGKKKLQQKDCSELKTQPRKTDRRTGKGDTRATWRRLKRTQSQLNPSEGRRVRKQR